MDIVWILLVVFVILPFVIMPLCQKGANLGQSSYDYGSISNRRENDYMNNRTSGYNAFHNILQSLLSVRFGLQKSEIVEMFPVEHWEHGYGSSSFRKNNQEMDFTATYSFDLTSHRLKEIHIHVVGTNPNLPSRYNELIEIISSKNYPFSGVLLNNHEFGNEAVNISLSGAEEGDDEFFIYLTVKCANPQNQSYNYKLPRSYVYDS